MKILLDTNALIWWMEDEQMLGSKARDLLANPAHTVLATIVSLWEITMKWRVGKYPLPGSAFEPFIQEENIELISVLPKHISAIESLGFYHKDPFDHLILTQAKIEGARLLTSDKAMAQYGIDCIKAH
jgi:PIN domain nuclease of toxin-antitoxin system